MTLSELQAKYEKLKKQAFEDIKMHWKNSDNIQDHKLSMKNNKKWEQRNRDAGIYIEICHDISKIIDRKPAEKEVEDIDLLDDLCSGFVQLVFNICKPDF